MSVTALDHALLLAVVVLLFAVLAVRASTAIGLPSLLVYLAMGVVLGESLLGVRFDDAATARALGYAALAVILAQGGLTTRWSEVRPSLGPGLMLATVGVAVSTGVVGVVCHVGLGLSWREAMLLGAITSPTDAAAVFAVLRRVPLRPRVLGTLEVESGLNDAVAVVAVTVLSGGSVAGLHGGLGVLATTGVAAYEIVGGVVYGIAVGLLGRYLLRRVALPATGLYPVTVLATALLAYSGAATLHASGFAAVYVAALLLGASELPHRAATRSFAEGVAWLAQIGLFVMLGLLVSPGDFRVSEVVGGIVVGAVVTLVGRPVSVVCCALPFRIPWREQGFVSVSGLRGAVPIVLATVPLSVGLAHARTVFNVVFVLVVVLTVAQAPLLPTLARRLGVTVDRARDADVEVAPLEGITADLVQVHVTDQSRLHGVEVHELRLPRGVSVSLIVRGAQSFTPTGETLLRSGDDLLVVTPRQLREQTERRLQAVSRRGRLADWLPGR